MSNLVCYVTIDNIYNNKEASHAYKNIDNNCVFNTAIRQLGGDGPVAKVESGVVVAYNHYDDTIYKTEIEQLSNKNSFSECDGPDAVRGHMSYYHTTEEALNACMKDFPADSHFDL